MWGLCADAAHSLLAALEVFEKWFPYICLSRSLCTFVLFLTNWRTDPKGTSTLWLLKDVTHPSKASMGMVGEEKQGEDNKGSVKRGRVGGCYSTLHTPVSTGSWMRLSWACKSSRLDISYRGSVSLQPDRRGRHSQEKRWERWKTTAVDKRAQLKKPGVTVQPVPCNRAFAGNCRHSAHQLLMSQYLKTSWNIRMETIWDGEAQPLGGGSTAGRGWWEWSWHVELIMMCVIEDIL